MVDIPDAPWIQRAERYGDPCYRPYLDYIEEEECEEEYEEGCEE